MLRPPNGLSGQTEFEDTPDVILDLNVEAHRHIVEDAIVVLLAGQITEAEYWRSLSSLYNPLVDTHRDDDAEINNLISGFNFAAEKRENFLAHCRVRTVELMSDQGVRSSINEIAIELATKLQIPRATIDEVLRRNDVIE